MSAERRVKATARIPFAGREGVVLDTYLHPYKQRHYRLQIGVDRLWFREDELEPIEHARLAEDATPDGRADG